MRIVFITPKLNFKSAGGSVFDIDLKARALQELGHTVAMVTVFSGLNALIPPLPYPLVEEQITAKSQLGISWAIYKLLKKYEIGADFFHIDGHIFFYGAGLYKRLGGKVPIVAFFNRELVVFPQDIPSYEFGSVDFAPPTSFVIKAKEKIRFFIEKYIGTWLANKIEITTFTSPVIQKVYNDFGLNTKHQLINPDLAGGVIKPKQFKRTRAEGEPIHFLCAGRLIPTKGFDLAITSFSLMKKREGFRMTIAGGGPDEERLKKMADKLGVAKSITFTGWLTHDKLFPLFEKADVFIMPRWRKELTSVVLMEAMSYGLPSIIPQGGGVDWQAGGGAVRFSWDNAESLKDAMGLLGSDEGQRNAISANALKRLDELHYKNWVPPLERIMTDIINHKNHI